jgi:toxin ParE1/3/4
MRPVALRYTQRARRQLGSIHRYIRERNPEAATRVIARIRRSANLLRDFPRLGRHGLIPDTRELSVVGVPYVVVYQKGDDVIEVLGVYHTAQDRVRDFT